MKGIGQIELPELNQTVNSQNNNYTSEFNLVLQKLIWDGF